MMNLCIAFRLQVKGQEESQQKACQSVSHHPFKNIPCGKTIYIYPREHKRQHIEYNPTYHAQKKLFASQIRV